ncbi:hypothetical protein BOKEGFJH_00597 [Chlamydia avium]|uniref:Uncharacterized protein n=1 Tax=Chlamydia avium TaxID=1457141 RepID=A0ABP2X6S7_9CHLA|nr:hypothetical protein [Chlamydia avium]EPP37006.1 hypothetical protein CP10743SC13_0949 [Chlamydia psittaci 10_743_SC13]EPP38543.1 hypothetical protein CP10881SC42_0046 [Chlamydia avium]VVT43067.1 hypothetical protein BOKEGFJH_00597 [Chlamydia avium]
MENSDSPAYVILKQIAHRYLDHYYPTLSQLIPLCFSKHSLPTPYTNESSAPKQPIEKISSEPDKASEIIINNSEPQLLPIRDQRKTSSWEYHSPHSDLSKVEILRLSYRTLHPYVLSSPMEIPCRIFVDEEKNEEILFFNRLAKILTQQIFPTTLVLSIRNKDIFHNHEGFSLSLAPLTMIYYKIPNARYHQPFTKNESTWIPIYSSVYYENDPKLKRDLWARLNQLPFAYTQKLS